MNHLHCLEHSHTLKLEQVVQTAAEVDIACIVVEAVGIAVVAVDIVVVAVGIAVVEDCIVGPVELH